MNKKDVYTFGGVNQDISKSKHSKEFYYEGNNIRITSTDSQSTGSVSNEKGTKLVASIPDISIDTSKSIISYGDKTLKYLNSEITNQFNTNTTSGDNKIIGHVNARDNIILFSTDDNGFDCVWKLFEKDEVYDLQLLYIRNLGFSSENLIQAVFNFENTNIQKVYWVDGKNQLRFLNTEHSKENKYKEDLINVNSNTINIVGNFKANEPEITNVVSGGNHTAGMIQYAYNLYRLNASQTKLSPMSELVPLTKGEGLGGGDVNEVVGTTPVVSIKDLDPEYTHIKVYAVKYTSYNQSPSVSLIKDQEINSSRSLSVFDDGNIINEISLAEFLFLGSDPIIPKHIQSKDNILFSSNIKEQAFDIDLDTRAYSHDSFGIAKVYENPKLINNIIRANTTFVNTSTYELTENHDSINLNYDNSRYQKDGTTIGGEGKYLSYELRQRTDVSNPESKKFFKDNEVYRLGIQFYNRLGQKSFPKWIADFKAPEGNLEGKYNTLKVTFKPEFYIWLNTSSNFESEDDKPVGYKVLRANRTINDRTIITQGIINGMMSNYRNKENKSNEFSAEARSRAETGNKMPSLQRMFGTIPYGQLRGAKHYRKLDPVNDEDSQREVHKASSPDYWIAETFQYNTIMQLFSPETMFGFISTYDGLDLRIKGATKRNTEHFWGQERVTATKEIVQEGKVLGAMTPHYRPPGSNEDTVIGEVNNLADKGLFGPANASTDSSMDFLQLYRGFDGEYIKGNGRSYPVYGKPILTEKGQGLTTYNNDGAFKFYNTLQPMLVDGGDSNKGDDEDGPALTSINSWGTDCITYVLGGKNVRVEDRIKLEDLWEQSGIQENEVALVAELVKNSQQIYLGNIYGGNSYEDKKRTNYIEIGNYTPININAVNILSPGDTFVQNFTFAKIVKTDTEVYTATSEQITEIVTTRVESSIDLRNRNDFSLNSWDARFQPRYDEFHKYNRVYSQQPTLIQTQAPDYNFRKLKSFDTRVMASKTKIPGEFIDSWTDMLVNEVQDLNGQFGPINGLIHFRDDLYAFQDKSIAFLSINPRVQVQGSDGIAVELGSGRVLHDYKYISTDSGSLNKWAIVPTQYAIYYLDTINKSFNRFSNKVEKLSDLHGLHTWFNTKIDYDTIKKDNPVLGQGANIGYDIVNNTIMLSLHQGTPYTRMFNEARNKFIGLMDYCPTNYLVNNSRLLGIDDINKNIHEHFKGEYNYFYGQYYPSYITLVLNPNVHGECTFNNIQFNSELYKDSKDLYDKTLTHIHTWNEYQDSGEVPLIFGRNNNLSRKVRTWRADIPREGRNRMKSPWLFLKLKLENEDDYKLILHDLIIDYNVV